MARKKPRKAAPRKQSHPLEKGMEQFGKEMGALGERIGKRFDERHKTDGRRQESPSGQKWRENWWHRTFGLVGPFVSSVFGLVIIALGIWLINFVNLPISSGFLIGITSFLTVNIGLLFLLFLFFSYTSYFSRHHSMGYRPFMPLAIAVSITAALWLVMNAVTIANISFGYDILAVTAFWMGRLLPVIFGLSVFIGYLALVIKISMENPQERVTMARHERYERRARSHEAEVRRLYRSSKDKILGGVCGGLGEYFGIDPVIIRLIFVILALGWGFGILLYIIAWIIIPRNPEHKWDR